MIISISSALMPTMASPRSSESSAMSLASVKFAIVKAVANFADAKLIAELSEDLGEAMVGINADEIEIIMEERGR